MSIVKNTPHILKHCRSGWTNLQNKTIDAIKDPATLGVYVYLASKPEDWTISETNLRNRFGKGRDFIRARLADLKQIGLLKTHAIKDNKGRVTRWETVLYNEIQNTGFQECASDVQITENPESGKPRHLEKPPTTKERYKQKKESKKEISSYSATDVAQEREDDDFNSFWDIYPIKKNKIRAKRIWVCKKLNKIAVLIMKDVAHRKAHDSQWKDVQFIPHPSTYLQNELWDDEITSHSKNRNEHPVTASIREFKKTYQSAEFTALMN